MSPRLAGVIKQIIDSGIPLELLGSIGGNPIALGALGARAIPLVMEIVSKLATEDAGAKTASEAENALAARLEAALDVARGEARREVDQARDVLGLVYDQASDLD